MEKLQLQSKSRVLSAEQDPNKLRKAGMVPAELYGHNIPNTHLSINANEFGKVLRKAGESTIIELMTEDGKVHNVLIQDVQKHYLHSQPIHVDFYEVSMTEKLTATIPLEFTGESMAVKAMGGTLVKVLNEIEVECLPVDLPHAITVDISVLKSFDRSILVKDLKVSDKVTVVTDHEETVAKVQPPRDVEAELSQPIDFDVSKVEGAAEEKPVAEATEEAKEE